MATRHIPAVTIRTCDRCGRGDTARWKKDARITMKRHGLDMLGDAACDATVVLDLCDECETIVTNAINSVSLSPSEKEPPHAP